MEQYWDFQEDFFNFKDFEAMKIEDEKGCTVYDEFRQRFTTNPYYFEHWLTSWSIPAVLEWPSEVFDKYMKKVLRFVQKPRKRRELQDCEFSEQDSLEATVGFFLEAFMFLSRWEGYRRPTLLIRGGVTYAEKFVKSKEMHEDYLPGVLYLYRWCLLYIYLLKGKTPPGALPEEYNGEEEYDALPQLSKGIVVAAMALFASGLENPSTAQECVNFMREAARLDPKAFSWHYILGNWLHCRRKRKCFGHLNGPTEEELQVFWETYNFRDEKSSNRMLALAGLVQAVAEVMRARFDQKATDFPITIGNMVFENKQEMLGFVLNNVAKMMTGEGPQYGELIRCGDILSNILPSQHRDYLAAEVYYKKALELEPDLSKINHKLGTLYFTSKKLYDLEKATKHLRQAVKKDNSNFPALMDLIHILLNSPDENREEIEALIQSELTASSKDKCQVLFVNACLKFMTGEKNEAILEWVKVFKIGPDTELFVKMFPKTCRRYKLNIKLTEIHAAIEDLLFEDATVSEEDKGILTKISGFLREREPQPKQYLQNNKKNFAADLDNNWRSSPPPVTAEQTFHNPACQRTFNNHSRNNHVLIPLNNQTPNKYVPPHKRNV